MAANCSQYASFHNRCSPELMFFASVLAVASWALGGGERLENVSGSILWAAAPSCIRLGLQFPTRNHVASSDASVLTPLRIDVIPKIF